MGVLIAYDIADPRRWRRVYKRVQADAARLQYSLFYGELNSRELDLLAVDVGRMIDPSYDDVRLYVLPDDAWIRLRGKPIVPDGVHIGTLSRLLARNDVS